MLHSQEKFGDEDLIVVIAGNFGSSTGATFVEISQLKQLLERQQHFINQRSSAAFQAPTTV